MIRLYQSDIFSPFCPFSWWQGRSANFIYFKVNFMMDQSIEIHKKIKPHRVMWFINLWPPYVSVAAIVKYSCNCCSPVVLYFHVHTHDERFRVRDLQQIEIFLEMYLQYGQEYTNLFWYCTYRVASIILGLPLLHQILPLPYMQASIGHTYPSKQNVHQSPPQMLTATRFPSGNFTFPVVCIVNPPF